MIKYSILVPVHNQLEFLKKYFKFIQNQSYTNYEIVVVDDYSTDGSYEYLSNLNDPKIHLIRNSKNFGIGETRNILLSNACGEYVLFVDPDDYIEPDLLLNIDKENDNLDIIRFQNVIEPATENQKQLEYGKDPYRYSVEPTGVITGEEALLKWCLGEKQINTFPWTYAIKKELYNGTTFPSTNVLEDFAIIPYVLAKSKKVKAIDYLGYHYMKYDESLSANKNSIEFKKRKLDTFKRILLLAEHYILLTDISDAAKMTYIKDIHNRYRIRKEAIEREEASK
jgi:glycosyltransferase involved in cell wall biosynthesis